MDCKDGRVNKEREKILEHTRDASYDECKAKCLEYEGCYTFDFSDTGEYDASSSCGLYGPNAEITDAGPNGRRYCEHSGTHFFEEIPFLEF